jgi:hypothetical protein
MLKGSWEALWTFAVAFGLAATSQWYAANLMGAKVHTLYLFTVGLLLGVAIASRQLPPTWLLFGCFGVLGIIVPEDPFWVIPENPLGIILSSLTRASVLGGLYLGASLITAQWRWGRSVKLVLHSVLTALVVALLVSAFMP